MDSEIRIEAKYDCVMGKHYHYTVGNPGDKINGGIYIKVETPIPPQLIITFAKEK